MQFEKKEILTYRKGNAVQDQFFLNEDYNVPDAKPDVQRILLGEGKAVVEDMRKVENYIRVTGKIEFQVLYVPDGGMVRLASMEGKLPFEEMVYMEEVPEGSLFVKKADVELTASMIHSRKLNIKAVTEMEIVSEGQETMTITMDAEAENSVLKRKKEEEVLKLFTMKQDSFRIKEEINIDGTKENISSLIWCKTEGRKLDIRIGTDEVQLQGEIIFFCFYETEEGNIEWMEQIVPYQGTVKLYGVKESMYHQIYPVLKDIITDIRIDEDGEQRKIGIEATLELKIVIYEEEKVEVLEDLYVLDHKSILKKEEMKLEQLLMQNHLKCKVVERLSLPEIKDDILQICHSSAKVQLESTEIRENGIQAEGVLHVSFIYVKPNDVMPFDMWHGMVPFSCLVESNVVTADMEVLMSAALEQMVIGLLGSDEIEIKAVIAFQCLLKKMIHMNNIEEAEFLPMEQKELEKMPGIVGYIVKDGDSLWNLAKKYNTTIESIEEMNSLDAKELKPGQKILIFKEKMGIL